MSKGEIAMKQMIALTLALALLGGCGSAPPASSASQQLSGEKVSGIITKVNGNEISLELVTLRQGAGAFPSGEETGTEAAAPPAGGSGQGQGQDQGGRSSGQGQGSRASGQGDRGTKAPPAGQNGGTAGESFGGGMPSEAGGMPSKAGGMSPGAGGMPPGAGGDGGAGAAAQSYTRTGETALYQIPVGAEVITLTGTSRDFNSLSPDLLVTITFREDGVTPGQVQVVQSLS